MANELKQNNVHYLLTRYAKIKSISMQAARMVQAVILMTLMALAASCSTGKEYTAKVFAPRNPAEKNPPLYAPRFLELERLETDKRDWVSTESITGASNDSTAQKPEQTAKEIPLSPEKEKPATAEVKKTPPDEEPVARSGSAANGVRNKRTRE